MTAADVELLYLKSVEHIARNDDPTVLDVAAVRSQVSVALVADVFGRTVGQVATHVVRLRRRASSGRCSCALQLRCLPGMLGTARCGTCGGAVEP